MKALIFTIIIALLGFIVISDLRDPPEHMQTEADKVKDFLEDYAFNTPKHIGVLFQDEVDIKDSRKVIKTIIVRSNEEFLPKSPRAPDKYTVVLNEMKKHLPEHNFGEQVSEKGSFFSWVSPDAQWNVSSIETSMGHYSKWVRSADKYQLSNE